MTSNRSVVFIVVVLALLALGAVAAYALPPLAGDTDVRDLSELVARLPFFSDKGWTFDLARAGVLIAAVAAIAFPASQRMLRATVVTLGVLATLPFPLEVSSLLGESGALGPGLLVAPAAFIAAALVAWVAALGGRKSGVETGASAHSG